MAELIKTGLDYNAYCRAEGLLAEENLIACYNLIEHFCAGISANLSVMNKQKECPDDCKEAVQSLIYATARFSEFPELKELRTQFLERYGTCLEPFVSKEFVELLKQKQVTKEVKLELMHGIAKEYRIEWDAKFLEQKLFKPPPQQHDQHGPRLSVNSEAERKSAPDDRWRQQISIETDLFSGSGRDSSTDQDSLMASPSSVESASDEEMDSKKQGSGRFGPPPYVIKSDTRKEEIKTTGSTKPADNNVAAAGNGQPHHRTTGESKPRPKSVRSRHSRPQPTSGVEDNNGNQRDEEEKMLDNLLVHYSKKESPPSLDQPTKPNQYLKPPPGWKGNNNDIGEATALGKAQSELPLPPGRTATSYPEALGPDEKARRHTNNQATALQAETLSGNGHPPDFDELAARVAAFKGTGR
ncbi:hypothetical protein Tsubulata_043331 [Turnera subulata]|uniref:Uncharacterized protein n=1 Tax=Turnera subulata TaxID=218843 RepID=A0A9Q0FRY8_9ROSI|nr:hypothetical protein Tsubulata_043331 [Turnera subulata]